PNKGAVLVLLVVVLIVSSVAWVSFLHH
ncbi:MAG: hypothetical protein RIS19_94, partial [Actinomycetota bacterium]